MDTGDTISIVAKKVLPRRDLKNIMPTAVIRMGDAPPSGAIFRKKRVNEPFQNVFVRTPPPLFGGAECKRHASGVQEITLWVGFE